MKISKINLKKISDKRKQQILFMGLAVVLITVAVPLTLYFINNWNESMFAQADNYSTLGENDFQNISITNENTAYKIQTYTPLMSFTEQTTVLWNETGPSTMVCNANTQKNLYWITKYNISDMINGDLTRWKFNIEMSHVLTTDKEFRIALAPWTGDKITLPTTVSQNNILCSKLWPSTSSVYLNFTWNTTVLDLMESKVYNGESRLIFWFDGDTPGSFLQTGDSVTFDFQIYEVEDPIINTNTVLKYGSAILGGLLIIIAIGSTSLWNPLQKNNPGIVDNGFKFVSGFFRRKK